MRVALDAMGGDHGPAPLVAGAVQALRADNNLRIILVGDEAQIKPILARQEAIPHRLDLFHSSQALTREDSVLLGLRTKPDSSIARCWQLIAEKKVEAMVSSGPQGGIVAAGLRLKRFLPNVRRPGLAATMPTLRGPCVLIDAGANYTPRGGHLYQYGAMGALFAKHLLLKAKPTIGMLRSRELDASSHELAREAQTLFQQSPWQPHFIGMVDGRDLFRGTADVVVCDAFTGNMAINVSEGLFDFVMKLAAHELVNALTEEQRPKAEEALQTLSQRYDPSVTGFAPLLGVDGICIVCNGSSGDKAIKNAISAASRYSAIGLNQLIANDLEAGPLAGTSEDG